MEGKVVCVTGASRGIGAEICIKLANAGSTVIGLARGIDQIMQLTKQIKNKRGVIVGRKCDLQNEQEIQEAFIWIKQEHGKLDVFINNAGMMFSKFLMDEEPENFRKMFEVNVIASCICLKEAIQIMKETTGKGHIIVMNSILGHRVPDIPFPLKPSFGVYPGTKFALTGICQSLRQEINYSKLAIKLTSISPGMVDSEMLNSMNQEIVALLPKLKVEDIAEAVFYAINTPDRVTIDKIIISPMLC